MAFFNRGRWAMLAATLLVQLSFSPAGPAHAAPTPEPAKKTVTITILHTNDMHGHVLPEIDKGISPTEKVGGAAVLAGYVNQERKAHPGRVLLLDSGDMSQGVAVSNMTRGRIMADFMNYLKYDAGTIGNHEFDWGPRAFANMIRWAERPIVCANFRLRGSKDYPANIRPYLIKNVGGIPVGITGVITAETPAISFKKHVADFDFLDPAPILRELIPQMRKEGARAIIVLSHCGVKADQALAAAVPGITAIIGGHSHTTVMDPIMVNDTVVVQAGKYMHHLGRLELTLDAATGKMVAHTEKAELIPLYASKIEPDPTVAALVKKYDDQVAPIKNTVLGQLSADLNRKADAGYADSPLGCAITDSLRETGGTDVAVYNAGGIRNDLNKGTITKGDIYSVLPFDNVLVTLELTGKQLHLLLQQGARESTSTLQVSGVTFTVTAAGKVSDILVGGKPLDPSKRYTLTTVDFVADGNDGYTVLHGIDRKVGELQREVFEQYVAKHSPLGAVASSRIRFLKKDGPPTR